MIQLYPRTVIDSTPREVSQGIVPSANRELTKEMLMPFNDAYEAGKAYYRRHKDKLRIPYPAGSVEYNAFESGWTQEQIGRAHV